MTPPPSRDTPSGPGSRMSGPLRWLVRGQHHTEQGFADQGEAIRVLQEQVAELRNSVAQLELAGGAEAVDATRAEVRAAIDDLGRRIDAITARLDNDASPRSSS